MYIIAGLGNPGTKYNHTRHNVGFETLDILIDEYRATGPFEKWKAMYGSAYIGGEKVIFVKPLTYMNLSGEAVRAVVDFFKIDPETELIVINDDIDLDPGRIRIRKSGSAGGHNGLKSIITHLGTEKFTRIRIGVGKKPAEWDLVDHVLGHFPEEELPKVREAMERAAKAAACIVTEGPDIAMNLYNEKKQKKPKPQKTPEQESGTEQADQG